MQPVGLELSLTNQPGAIADVPITVDATLPDEPQETLEGQVNVEVERPVQRQWHRLPVCGSSIDRLEACPTFQVGQ